jgi:hypothetical protein
MYGIVFGCLSERYNTIMTLRGQSRKKKTLKALETTPMERVIQQKH